ncbi:type II toxin-antitoxin system PemK/MazF family toxin [Huintestinicola sp.]|uniref:type II toxin-antitoxin system PemK/MazF family toxin n=1 Tax=Huintestinicola sp. TaxID=2981661 RepID=UPI003D7E0508
MVKQGDIIKVSFDPQSGHEQAGYRPAVIVSSDYFIEKTKLVIACPITNTNNRFPTHVPLDERTKTTGVILCEHIRSLDLNSRPHSVTETLPDDILKKVIDIIFSEIDDIT